jgi:hypothetical protein
MSCRINSVLSAGLDAASFSYVDNGKGGTVSFGTGRIVLTVPQRGARLREISARIHLFMKYHEVLDDETTEAFLKISNEIPFGSEGSRLSGAEWR